MAREAITPPSYLKESSRAAFEALAESGQVSQSDAGLLAKYVIAEGEYLRITNHVTAALNAGDAKAASAWLAAQNSITNQLISLGGELGLTTKARIARGLPYVR